MAVGRPTKPLNVTAEEKEKLTLLARRPITKLRTWLARHPRYHVHFIPTSSLEVHLVMDNYYSPASIPEFW